MESFAAHEPGSFDSDRRRWNVVFDGEIKRGSKQNRFDMTPAATPVATPFFFYLIAAIMVIGGILVITRKNAVPSALALILTLLAQAALYLMLYAPFVAGVQIILYAGGIMVLFLFVIMLVNIEKAQKEEQFNQQWLVGLAAAVALGALFVLVYVKGRALFPDRAILMPEQAN